MAYCSYCAAVLSPGQTVCPQCNRPTGAAPPAAVVIGADARPSSVRLGVGLLALSWGISLLGLAGVFLRAGMIARLPGPFFLRTIGLLILWIVLMICVWQRQAWARIAIALLLFWGITNLMTTGLRMGGSMASAASLAFPLLIAIMRACAVYLLFRPDSNAWFKK